ncbi:HNH endonuclease [Sphingobium phenoxybenzoativorans]|uniref:HNH endonuclease n=1 Tax=Sphingobium phenoxybenzoativorans TaxID=1592790 RepID=A0A975KBM8_9SPHN|nr:HNH endonuclease [Sphingobium phenoxybenzoativorans]QUT07939.1 HNH endonuclease [Sphingobium phenoxybenzoativorans]
MARKAISKTARFEVFKRDGFTCQYCGNHPPHAILEVDHIIAVAAGGENDEDNLVTACFNCNRGKAARSLDLVPQSLASKAAEVAEREAQLAGYNAILNAKRERLEAHVWRVVEHLTGEAKTSHERFSSIKKFVDILGLHEVLDAVDITKGRRPHADYAQWKYFCGVCWTKIRESGL